MKGDTIAVKNTLFEDYMGPRLPRQVQLTRVRNVISRELTPMQRETVLAYYFQGLNICQIAQQRGSTKVPSAGHSIGRKNVCGAVSGTDYK